MVSEASQRRRLLAAAVAIAGACGLLAAAGLTLRGNEGEGVAGLYQTCPSTDEEYAAAMDRWFPNTRRVTIKDAGHWVHSEQPEVFVEVLRRFAD